MKTELATHNRISANWFLETGLFLFLSMTLIPSVSAQNALSTNSHANISGTVFLEGGAHPAARVKVDVRAISGGGIATTYTDSGGRFEAASSYGGAYVVSIAEPGYEPVEQHVDANSGLSGVIFTLKPVKSSPSPEGYTVSVHDLNVPGKARKEFEKGLDRLQKRDFEGGISHFKEATDAFPDYYEAFYQLGLANLELRRRDDAERALQKAIDLSGGHNADPQFALGALLCDRGQYSDAERVIRLGLESDSTSWRGYLFLGQALFGQNQLPAAEKNARFALSRRSDLSSAYILLANIAIRRHDYRTAINELDTFLRLKPDGPTSDQARDVRNAAERVVNRFERIFSVPQFVY